MKNPFSGLASKLTGQGKSAAEEAQKKPEEAKKFNIEVNSYDGELRCTFTVGMNYTREMKHAQLTDRFINLQLFNDKVLERLFKDKIEKNETDYLYITSDLLSGEYENYELG